MPVIGVTGSAGKTTVKEMIAAILRQAGSVMATQGNFNNEIGVPLTLSRLTAEHDFAVVEMGANHAGEIRFLVGLAKPVPWQLRQKHLDLGYQAMTTPTRAIPCRIVPELHRSRTWMMG